MRFIIATKDCALSTASKEYVGQHTKKLSTLLSKRSLSPSLLDILIKKHKRVTSASDRSSVDNPIYYDGTIKLVLPKKPLVVRMIGKTIDEAVKNSFAKLTKKLETYKGKHISSNSKYLDHSTIRKGG
ncbi:MAG: hypothetical protein A2687_05240 [Candidatus Levybacteria bacterium RIFCSPHIGHO2_01_FULL_38_26]|nr:MAG: hypothetical protein A2687_05240 [Candidatus Levybacteria bacterium RIFCSPHIGHO2_01_FULL_38_26]